MAKMLGLTVRDRVTRFCGVVTGQVTYLTGCNQCLVVPTVKDDGTLRDGQWFDEQRLDVLDAIDRIVLDNENASGFDAAPPRRL